MRFHHLLYYNICMYPISWPTLPTCIAVKFFSLYIHKTFLLLYLSQPSLSKRKSSPCAFHRNLSKVFAISTARGPTGFGFRPVQGMFGWAGNGRGRGPTSVDQVRVQTFAAHSERPPVCSIPAHPVFSRQRRQIPSPSRRSWTCRRAAAGGAGGAPGRTCLSSWPFSCSSSRPPSSSHPPTPPCSAPYSLSPPPPAVPTLPVPGAGAQRSSRARGSCGTRRTAGSATRWASSGTPRWQPRC